MKADRCNHIFADYADVLLALREQEVFSTQGQSDDAAIPPCAAIDVYIDPRNSINAFGCIVRVYARADQVETLVAQRVLGISGQGGAISGRIVRGRGGATQWRVTIEATQAGTPGLTVSMGYVAWGREPVQGDPGGWDEGQQPALPPVWRQFQTIAGGSTWRLDGFPPPAGVEPAPCYVRQIFGSVCVNAPATPYWIQITNRDPAGGFATLLAHFQVNAVGDPYNFDFRDVHRAAFDNDGLFSFHGAWIGFSSDPTGYVAAVGTVTSVMCELRLPKLWTV